MAVNTITRRSLIDAIEWALHSSGIKDGAADLLRQVGKTAERIAWGTFRTFDANGVEYKCPLGQTNLCKPVMHSTTDVRLSGEAREFYTAFDKNMSRAGFHTIALTVTD